MHVRCGVSLCLLLDVGYSQMCSSTCSVQVARSALNLEHTPVKEAGILRSHAGKVGFRAKPLSCIFATDELFPCSCRLWAYIPSAS